MWKLWAEIYAFNIKYDFVPTGQGFAKNSRTKFYENPANSLIAKFFFTPTHALSHTTMY
jgi:hypothetical protein